jgi:hypothetical protein
MRKTGTLLPVEEKQDVPCTPGNVTEMTVSTIKKVFRNMDSTEQAALLKELASTLADSLAMADARDAEAFATRRREEPQAQPWREVSRRLASPARQSRKRRR